MDKRPPYLIPDEGGGLSEDWPLRLFEELIPCARHFKPNREDARDLAQRTIIRAERHICRLRNAENMRAWLWKVMRNLHIDDWRKERRETFNQNTVEPSQPLKDAMADVPDELKLADGSPWFMSLVEKAPFELKEFARVADKVGWRNLAITERLSKETQYANVSIDKVAHFVRRSKQRLEDWMWKYIGLLTEVKTHLAYERDPLYKAYPVSQWKSQLQLFARRLANDEPPENYSQN